MALTITHSNSTQTGVRKRTLEQVFHLGPVSIKFITLIIGAALLLFYVAQSTQGATSGYDLRAVKEKQDELKDNLEELKTQELRFKALGTLNEDAKAAGLVPAN